MKLKGEEILNRVREFIGDEHFSRYDEINEAYLVLMRQTGTFNSKREDTSLSFKSGESVYQLPMDRIRSLIGIWIRDDTTWRELKEVDEEGFQNVEIDTTVSTVPTVFKSISRGMIEVSKEPEASYPVKLVFIGTPEPLGPNSYSELPAGYDIEIARLAATNWISLNDVTEAGVAKARALGSSVGNAMRDMASDTNQNRGVGVSIPRQKVLRA